MVCQHNYGLEFSQIPRPTPQSICRQHKSDDIQFYSLTCHTSHFFVEYKRFSLCKGLPRTTFNILKTLDIAYYNDDYPQWKNDINGVKTCFSESHKTYAFRKSSRTSKEHKPFKHAASLSTSTRISISKKHFVHSADFEWLQSTFELKTLKSWMPSTISYNSIYSTYTKIKERWTRTHEWE